MREITVYGIPNCDTVKKVLDWLKVNKVEYRFHDYKKQGITKEKLNEWCMQVGWEILLNKKGTTWRALDPEVQAKATSRTAAVKIMINNPSIIKRPVIETGTILLVGFNKEEYHQNIKQKK